MKGVFMNSFQIKLILLCFFLIPSAFAVVPPKGLISVEQARTNAIKIYSDKIQGGNLDTENGVWVYSFIVLDEQNDPHKIFIDAKSGNVADTIPEVSTSNSYEFHHR